MIRNQATNRLVKFGGSHYKDLLKRQTADPSRKYFLKKDIARLRRRLIRGGGDDDDLYTCPICLDNEQENPHMIAVWPCGHLFCEMCIREYCFGKNLCVCPTCRQKIVEPKKLLNEQRRPESWGEAEVIRMSTKDKRALENRRKRKETTKEDPVSKLHHYKRFELRFNMYMGIREMERTSLSKQIGPFIESITRALLDKNEELTKRGNSSSTIFSIVYSFHKNTVEDRPAMRKVLERRKRTAGVVYAAVCTFKLDVVFRFDNTSQFNKHRRAHVSQLIGNVREMVNRSAVDDDLGGGRPFFDLVDYMPGAEWTSHNLSAMIFYLTGLLSDYETTLALRSLNTNLMNLRTAVERLETLEGDREAIARQLEEHENDRERYLRELRELNPRGENPINIYTRMIKEDDTTVIRKEIARLIDMREKAAPSTETAAGPSGVRNHTFYTECDLRVNYVMFYDKVRLTQEMRRDPTFGETLRNHNDAAETLARSHILIRINGNTRNGVSVKSIIVKKTQRADPLSDAMSTDLADYRKTEGANPNMGARVLVTLKVELVLGCAIADRETRAEVLSQALGELSVREESVGLLSDAETLGFRYVFDVHRFRTTTREWIEEDSVQMYYYTEKLTKAAVDPEVLSLYRL